VFVASYHLSDYSYHGSGNPDVVLNVNTEHEIVDVVKLCDAHTVPIVPYGAGTSLEGHTTATKGGVCLNMKSMDKIIAIHEKDMDVVVEPGERDHSVF